MPERLRVIRVPQSPQEKRKLWASLPGVSFPEPEPEPAVVRAECRGAEELPDTREWVCNAEAAASLQMSAGGAALKLHKLGVPYLRARGKLFWSRREVAALAGDREELALPPAGWMLAQESLARLGCGRSALDRYKQKGRLRCRETLVGGKRRNLYNAEDVERLAALLRAERETSAALREWR